MSSPNQQSRTSKSDSKGMNSLSLNEQERFSTLRISDSSSQGRYSESISSSRKSASSLDVKNGTERESNGSDLKIDETKADDTIEFIYAWGRITRLDPSTVKVRSKTYLRNRVKESADERVLFKLVHCQCIRVEFILLHSC